MTDVDILVIGLGPAGLAACLRWVEHGSHGSLMAVDAGLEANLKNCTIQLNRGCRMANPCATVSGAGGSAMLAGGKLSVLPAGRGIEKVAGGVAAAESAVDDAFAVLRSYLHLEKIVVDPLQIANETTWYLERGFNYRYYQAYKYSASAISNAYRDMVATLQSASVDVRFQTEVVGISQLDNDRYSVRLRDPSGTSRIVAKTVVLAFGRNGDSLLGLLEVPGVKANPPAHVDAGVRLEFPSRAWPDIDACHNDLKLLFGTARTFCASRDGWVAPYRHRDIFLVEGRTDIEQKSGFTNIAVTIRISAGASNVLDLARRQLLAQTGGRPLRQPLNDFLGDEETPTWTHLAAPPASISYWRLGDARKLWRPDHATSMRNAVEHFTQLLVPSVRSATSIFGPEIDYYWRRPEVTIGGRTGSKGVFVAGDATGIFRGIVQAFSSGRIAMDSALRQGGIHA